MESLVAELPELYRIATTASVEAFPDEVLKRLHRWIDFDGAVSGSGLAPAHGVHITSVCVDRRDPHILDDYALITEDDPVTAGLMREPGLAHAVDTRRAYAGKPYAAMRAFAAATTCATCCSSAIRGAPTARCAGSCSITAPIARSMRRPARGYGRSGSTSRARPT